MSVIVEYSVDAGKEPLGEALTRHRDVRADVCEPVGAGDGSSLFAWVSGDADLETVERWLSADRTVAEVTRLCDVEGRGLYQFRLEPDVESHRDWRAGGGERLESHAVGGRWYDRVRFPDGESGSAYLEALHEAGVDARPHEMYESTKRGEARSGLTDLQRRTLELAYQQGFFEIPRKVTIGDLADQLGVSDQAVSERLRRGYATLVGSTLG